MHTRCNMFLISFVLLTTAMASIRGNIILAASQSSSAQSSSAQYPSLPPDQIAATVVTDAQLVPPLSLPDSSPLDKSAVFGAGSSKGNSGMVPQQKQIVSPSQVLVSMSSDRPSSTDLSVVNLQAKTSSSSSSVDASEREAVQLPLCLPTMINFSITMPPFTRKAMITSKIDLDSPVGSELQQSILTWAVSSTSKKITPLLATLATAINGPIGLHHGRQTDLLTFGSTNVQATQVLLTCLEWVNSGNVPSVFASVKNAQNIDVVSNVLALGCRRFSICNGWENDEDAVVSISSSDSEVDLAAADSVSSRSVAQDQQSRMVQVSKPGKIALFWLDIRKDFFPGLTEQMMRARCTCLGTLLLNLVNKTGWTSDLYRNLLSTSKTFNSALKSTNAVVVDEASESSSVRSVQDGDAVVNEASAETVSALISWVAIFNQTMSTATQISEDDVRFAMVLSFVNSAEQSDTSTVVVDAINSCNYIAALDALYTLMIPEELDAKLLDINRLKNHVLLLCNLTITQQYRLAIVCEAAVIAKMIEKAYGSSLAQLSASNLASAMSAVTGLFGQQFLSNVTHSLLVSWILNAQLMAPGTTTTTVLKFVHNIADTACLAIAASDWAIFGNIFDTFIQRQTIDAFTRMLFLWGIIIGVNIEHGVGIVNMPDQPLQRPDQSYSGLLVGMENYLELVITSNQTFFISVVKNIKEGCSSMANLSWLVSPEIGIDSPIRVLAAATLAISLTVISDTNVHLIGKGFLTDDMISDITNVACITKGIKTIFALAASLQNTGLTDNVLQQGSSDDRDLFADLCKHWGNMLQSCCTVYSGGMVMQGSSGEESF